MKLTIAAIALLLILGDGAAFAQPPQASSSPPAVAAAGKDPASLALLKRMCDRLQAAKTFNVRGWASLELPVAGGEVATFFNQFDISVRRPNGLAARRTGDLEEFRFAFDGKTMTVYVPGLKEWGTTSAPATLDAMLPAAGEAGGLNLPFDEVLVADPYAAITTGLTEAMQLGPATIQGKKVEHLVLANDQIKVEYWIDPSTALPARALVIYTDHPLRHHFVVEYTEWKLDPKLSDATFAMPKPSGATEVNFRDASGAFR